EHQPAASLVVGRAHDRRLFDVTFREWFGGGQRRRRDVDTFPRERRADPRPGWVAQHAAGIEKKRRGRERPRHGLMTRETSPRRVETSTAGSFEGSARWYSTIG